MNNEEGGLKFLLQLESIEYKRGLLPGKNLVVTDPEPIPNEIKNLNLPLIFPEFGGETAIVRKTIREAISFNSLIIIAGLLITYGKLYCKSPQYKKYKESINTDGWIDRIDPILIEYINGEQWYLLLETITMDGFCKEAQYDHQINVVIEESKDKMEYTDGKKKKRRDNVWAITMKIKEASIYGYCKFKILDNIFKENEQKHGYLKYKFTNLTIKVNLIIKNIDEKFQKIGINYRTPEINIAYSFDDFNYEITEYPLSNSSSLNRTKMENILQDFVQEKIIHGKQELAERMTRNLYIKIADAVTKMSKIFDVFVILTYAINNDLQAIDNFLKIDTRTAIKTSTFIYDTINAIKHLFRENF